jgi:hypothetical protein
MTVELYSNNNLLFSGSKERFRWYFKKWFVKEHSMFPKPNKRINWCDNIMIIFREENAPENRNANKRIVKAQLYNLA